MTLKQASMAVCALMAIICTLGGQFEAGSIYVCTALLIGNLARE